MNRHQERLAPLDLAGDWESQPNGVWKFRCKDKAGLLWSESKGTVWFDGQPAVRAGLAAKIEAILADGVVKAPIDANSTIFVVHGRDIDARDQLDLILRKVGLEPFILQVTGGGGDTLIEALERMMGKAALSGLSSLTRKRCAILTKGFVEMPSNMDGVITIPFNDHVREAVPKLVQRLQESEFRLDPAAIGRAQG